MSKERVTALIGVVLSFVVALLAVFGYDVGVVQTRSAATGAEWSRAGSYATPCYHPEGGASYICGSGGTFVVGSGGAISVASGGAVMLASGATETIASGGTLAVASGATLTVKGVTVSGPLRFGVASTVISGTTIAHGVGTTPTVAFLTASSTITTPLFIQSMGPVSLTVGINDGVTVGSLSWAAGY